MSTLSFIFYLKSRNILIFPKSNRKVSKKKKSNIAEFQTRKSKIFQKSDKPVHSIVVV